MKIKKILYTLFGGVFLTAQVFAQNIPENEANEPVAVEENEEATETVEEVKKEDNLAEEKTSATSEEEKSPSQVLFQSYTLPLAKNGKLGVEATTEFVWDVNDNSTGLETNVGIELYLPLFDKVDRDIAQETYMEPGVRLVVEDMCFQWLETYFAKGGNYAQDDVNSWASNPLVLTYSDITADVVWKNFYLQVASTKNPMEVSLASLNSIFDDVMDTDDRWYIKKEYALYYKTRYNKLSLPLLGSQLSRDVVDPDYSDLVSGQIGFGFESSKFTALAKAASLYEGRDNDNNAWLFGLDTNIYPINDVSVKAQFMASVNCEDDLDSEPLAAGLSADYKIPLVGNIVLKPFVGADLFADRKDFSSTKTWELGGGTYLYFRGEDYLANHKDVDYDEIIPVGLSASANLYKEGDKSIKSNIIFSAFELADKKALIPNLGYFVELEMLNVGSHDMHTAVAGQVEYLIAKKVLPYLFVKYYPELSANGQSFLVNDIINFKAGVYMTPVQYFSIDINYSLSRFMNDEDKDSSQIIDDDKGALSVSCTIRL